MPNCWTTVPICWATVSISRSSEQRCRNGAGTVPQRCRNGAATVPQRCRRRFRGVDNGAANFVHKKKERIAEALLNGAELLDNGADLLGNGVNLPKL